MAQWVNRTRADGGVSVQIKWRQDGRWQSETFTDIRLASEFRSAVESAGHRWPTGWVRHEGWTIEETPTTPLVVTFAEVAVAEGGYFEAQGRRVKRGKLKPYTLHRYRRSYALHLEELFGHLGVPVGSAEKLLETDGREVLRLLLQGLADLASAGEGHRPDGVPGRGGR